MTVQSSALTQEIPQPITAGTRMYWAKPSFTLTLFLMVFPYIVEITCEGGRALATLTFGEDPVCQLVQYFLQYSWQFVSHIFLEPSTPPP